MQINDKSFRVFRGIRGIVTSIIFFLAGGLFVGLGIYFLLNPSGDQSNNPNHIVEILFIALGGIALLVGVIGVIRARASMRLSKPLSEEEVAANEAKLHEGEPDLPNIVDTKYFFHFAGKMNQSFFVEDKDGNVVYECRLKKWVPLGADTFEFVDVNHGYSKTIKAGKNVTSSSEGGMAFVGDTLTSRFKINGKMCWEYLRERGYEIKQYVLERPLFRYELCKLGKVVVDIKPCNVKDPFNEESRNVLRMGRGYYRIEIHDARLEDAVMAAFIIARTDMVE